MRARQIGGNTGNSPVPREQLERSLKSVETQALPMKTDSWCSRGAWVVFASLGVVLWAALVSYMYGSLGSQSWAGIGSSGTDDLGVHSCGPFAMSHIIVSVVDGARSYPDFVVTAAERHWTTMKNNNPALFDGPEWTLLSYEERLAKTRPREIHLRLQQSSYKFVLYTHHSEQGLLLPPTARSQACGFLALAETADKFLVIGQRSLTSGALPGHWHVVPSGQVDSPDIAGALKQELIEELGVDWSEVQESSMLALLDKGAEQGHAYEFVFTLKLKITSAQLHARYMVSSHKAEHPSLVLVKSPSWDSYGAPSETIPWATSGFQAFLQNTSYKLTDVTRRALLLLHSGCPQN